MHNKLFIADNSFAVSGGRNIANEYFMRSTAANFIDMDVLSSGPIVRELSQAFDLYWNSEHVLSDRQRRARSAWRPMPRSAASTTCARAAVPDVPIPPRDVLDKSPVGEQLVTGALDRYWAAARLYADDPDKIARAAERAYRGSVTEGALAVIGVGAARGQDRLALLHPRRDRHGADEEGRSTRA